MGDWGGNVCTPSKPARGLPQPCRRSPSSGEEARDDPVLPAQIPFPIPAFPAGIPSPAPLPRLSGKRSRRSPRAAEEPGCRLSLHPASRCHHLLKVSASNPGPILLTPSPGTQLRAASPDPAVPAPDPNPSHPCPPSPARLRACHGCNSRLNRLLGPQCQSRGGIQKAAEVLEYKVHIVGTLQC